MPIITTGSFDVQSLHSTINTATLAPLIDAWAKYAHETYAYRGSVADIKKLFTIVPVDNTTVKVVISKHATTLDQFQYKNYRDLIGGLTQRNIATKRITTKSMARVAQITKGRVLRSSAMVKLYELNPKLAKTPVFFIPSKQQLFARNQQPTWANGKRLPIHRVYTLPMAMYVASRRVENGFGLAARLNALGMTIISRA